jgi:uncharacterized protein YjbI with pentapeptide repeats
MEFMRWLLKSWLLKNKKPMAIGLGVVLGIVILIVAGIWFWGVLEEYVDPKDPTARKDVVQAFTLIIAGVVGLIGGIVSIISLRLQRALQEKRAQEDAKQAYFEQMGNLLRDKNWIDPERKEEIRQLAEAQTHTVLARLDGERKGAVIRFLHGAGLIRTNDPRQAIWPDVRRPSVSKPIVGLSGADLSKADLREAKLYWADLSRADLSNAKLSSAKLNHAALVQADLTRADLSGAVLGRAVLVQADLTGARLSEAVLSRADLRAAVLRNVDLREANLSRADLSRAQDITNEQVDKLAKSLEGATMPNGQKYEDWLKSRKEDGENSGSK